MTEQWLPIPTHDGYEVSDLGRVRSYITPGPRSSRRTSEPKILKPDVRRGGYQVLRLKGRRARFVHHLVMAAFIGPLPTGFEVDHLDNNPSNNRLSNLRYVTPAENYVARIRATGANALLKQPRPPWDWNLALDGLRAILAEVYGERNQP